MIAMFETPEGAVKPSPAGAAYHCASYPAALGSNPSISNIFQGDFFQGKSLMLLRLINSAGLYSGQGIENVDCTYLVQACGKPVQQKALR